MIERSGIVIFGLENIDTWFLKLTLCVRVVVPEIKLELVCLPFVSVGLQQSGYDECYRVTVARFNV